MCDDISADEVVDVFRLYVAYKLHFNSKKYVFTEDSMANKFNEHSLNDRSDIKTIIDVATEFRYKKVEMKDRFISMFKKSPNSWIGDSLQIKMNSYHDKRMSVIMNLTHNIEKDVSKVKDFMKMNTLELKDIVAVDNMDRPLLIKKLRLSDEFLALLDYYVPYLQQETENPLWKNRSFILHKYKYLIETNDFVKRSLESLE